MSLFGFKKPEDEKSKPSAEIIYLDEWRKAHGLPPARVRNIAYLDGDDMVR